MELPIGITGCCETAVRLENTAASVGSGLLPVFATPMMVALMENAAVNALTPYLEDGQGSVGTHMDVSHDAATPIGMTVRAEAELIEANGRALTFRVTAWDDAGPIGQGIHQRFIIDNERFMKKAQSKLG